MARGLYAGVYAQLQNGQNAEPDVCALVNALVMRASELLAIENHHELHKAQHEVATFGKSH
jgi:hypothetical protein